MTTDRRFSDHRSELLEQQPENGLALAFGPMLPLVGVMEHVAGGSPFETTARSVIEGVGGDFHDGSEVSGQVGGPLEASIQGSFKVADAFFLSSVVPGEVWWIVQGQHAEAGQNGIHILIVER